ncbi:uncharacterized protein BJ171DRAFT_513338 [Polychytrium aggregatum]|uniref:uncharacterized protein n=1 Tax=Polychytrium aggregatum TaxID=110093 RepID=UPI0022FE3BC8|nr:uncharacterized protein BJ171DRAFT_513338 [Polychytrium aggregatum]KAI9202522.1 hypothetical protein BJ171DRAFT_513338 [Polychytrium aggregatum]
MRLFSGFAQTAGLLSLAVAVRCSFEGHQHPLQQDVNPFTPPGTVVWACNSLDRGIVLTFDDGPSPGNTENLLDYLSKTGLKATFFVVGANAQRYPDVVRRIVNDGHLLGSHTWSHANLTDLVQTKGIDALASEIDRNEELLFGITQQRPWLFRPPYGAINEAIRKYLEDRGYTIVMWNAGCFDWYYQNVTQELVPLINGLPDAGAIVCMHDLYESTVGGLPVLVDAFTGTEGYINPQGRRIITMEECINPGRSAHSRNSQRSEL